MTTHKLQATPCYQCEIIIWVNPKYTNVLCSDCEDGFTEWFSEQMIQLG